MRIWFDTQDLKPGILSYGSAQRSHTLPSYQRQRRHRNVHTNLVFVVGLVITVVVVQRGREEATPYRHRLFRKLSKESAIAHRTLELRLVEHEGILLLQRRKPDLAHVVTGFAGQHLTKRLNGAKGQSA